MHSEEWRKKAHQIRKRDGYTCQVCGATDGPMEVHHLTYDRLYHECDEDLLTVCHDCHAKITKLWKDFRTKTKARKSFTYLISRFEYANGLANHLNVLTPHDISCGGKYVLTGSQNIQAACKDIGIEYRYEVRINETFNKIHIIDVSQKIAAGVPRWKIKEMGYPKSLVDNIEERRSKNESIFTDVSDELVCYLHEGQGEWVTTADEDGLNTTFDVMFVPRIRYENRWYE